MDDCLSAVDPQVGNLIFADCILGHMRHKTRVLVTHGIQYISHPAVSKIAVLHNGAMVEHGDFNTLNADTSSMLSLLVQKYKREAEDVRPAPHTLIHTLPYTHCYTHTATHMRPVGQSTGDEDSAQDLITQRFRPQIPIHAMLTRVMPVNR